MRRRERNAFRILALLMLLLACNGCVAIVSTRTDGTKTEYYSFLKRIEVGEATIPTPDGAIRIKDGSGNVDAAVSDTAATMRAIAEKGLVP